MLDQKRLNIHVAIDRLVLILIKADFLKRQNELSCLIEVTELNADMERFEL